MLISCRKATRGVPPRGVPAAALRMHDFDDFREEGERFRRVAEAEARLRGSLEQKRRGGAEKRAALEAQVAAAEEALRREKAEALAVHEELALAAEAARPGSGGLGGAWPGVEEAAAALRAADARLAETRRLAMERGEAEQQEVEEASSLYQVYCAGTGLRWDLHAPGIEGYVAIDDAVRAFEVPSDDQRGDVQLADALWKEIEACLPQYVPTGPQPTSEAVRAPRLVEQHDPHQRGWCHRGSRTRLEPPSSEDDDSDGGAARWVPAAAGASGDAER